MRPLVLSALLVACVPVAASARGADQGTCGAEKLQHLVGQPAAVLQTQHPEGPLRLLRPGDRATMDYRADRLNIRTDADDIIVRVDCG